MILLLNWDTFRTRFMITSKTIYVHETDDAWEFFTSDDVFTIKAIVEKPENMEDQLLMKQRLQGSAESNIISVMDVLEGNERKEGDDSLIVPEEQYEDENEPSGSTIGDQQADDL